MKIDKHEEICIVIGEEAILELDLIKNTSGESWRRANAMFGWQAGLAVAASAAILLTLLVTIIFRRCFSPSKQGITPPQQNRGKTELSPSEGISIAQIRARPNHRFFQRGSSTEPLFDWSEHPSLITDAFENGWSRFAFTNYASSPSTRSTLLPCGRQGDAAKVEIAWEVGEESVELMQKIRMNSGLKKLSSNSSSMAAKSVVKTALPLPGPLSGNSPVFPQEAYFEITILATPSSSDDKNTIDGDKVKLIRDFHGSKNSDSITHFGSGNANHRSEEFRLGSRGGERAGLMMSVGLTSSSFVPLKAPGSYRGSIGFNSDGSVYVDEWVHKQKVIGCGFNPLHKKVFFTLDSKLAHLINCKSEEFSSPLYPVIAANADVTVLVNLGQTRFHYEPANVSRTSNPCFLGSSMSSPAVYEDSGELFSMGRIDSGWLHHSATKSSTNSDVYSLYGGSYNRNGRLKSKANEEEDESEGDLFEIVLDVNDKSPKV
ncbi:hypothetical protein V2J09_017064 [Rumex salicifolius]